MKQSFLKSFAIAEYVALLFVFAGGLALMVQYIPSLDDFRYHYLLYDQSKPILCFGDIMKSQLWAFFNHNGRLLCHSVVHFMCGFGGLWPFYIGSALAFVLLLAFSLRVSRGYDGVVSVVDMPLLLTLLLTLNPQIGIVFFGSVAFTVNYLWSAAIYMAFIAVYFAVSRSNDSISRWWYSFFAFLFGVICGSWQESFSLGIAGSLFFFHLIHIRKTKGVQFWLVLGFGIGTALCAFAPSNFIRAANDSQAMNMHYLYQLLKGHAWFQLLTAITVISLVIDIRKRQELFVVRNWLLYGSIMFSFAFCFVIAYHDIYQLTSAIVFTGVLVVMFIRQYLLEHMTPFLRIVMSVVMLLFLIAVFCNGYKLRSVACNGYDEALSTFFDTKGCYMFDTKIQDLDKNLIPNTFVGKNLINRMYHLTLKGEPSLLNKFYGGDKMLCEHTICLPECPKDIVAHCVNENEVFDDVFIYKPLKYMIIRFDEEVNDEVCLVETLKSISFINKLKDKIKKRQEVINKVKISDLQSFQLGKRYYYVFPITHAKNNVVNYSISTK